MRQPENRGHALDGKAARSGLGAATSAMGGAPAVISRKCHPQHRASLSNEPGRVGDPGDRRTSIPEKVVERRRLFYMSISPSVHRLASI